MAYTAFPYLKGNYSDNRAQLLKTDDRTRGNLKKRVLAGQMRGEEKRFQQKGGAGLEQRISVLGEV